MKILLHPFTQKLRNGMDNAKSYPVDKWQEVIRVLGENNFIQVGSKGEQQLVPDHRTNLRIVELYSLVNSTDTWIGCDSFLQHLAKAMNKPGIVVWSVSDPKIFGYPENKNLIKSRSYLRKKQFDLWEYESFKPDAFVEPAVIIDALQEILQCAKY